jgi:penicillin-insensitive murein endopeptidase
MILRAAAIACAIPIAAASWSAEARAACGSDPDCTAAPFLKCDLSTAGGTCVQCVASTDCTNGLVCERDPARASFGHCVACTLAQTGACIREQAGAICLSSGACGCNVDDDCGLVTGGRVCAGGVCVIGCRGDGSRPCAIGQRCTARGAGTGECVDEPTPPVARADAGPTNPTPPVVGGGCSISEPSRSELDLEAAALVAILALAALRRRRLATGILVLTPLLGCSRTPTPLRPGYEGSVGLPHRGVLIGGVRVEPNDHLHFLRDNDRRWATPRFAATIARAADRVAKERPGSVLVVGDLSQKGGGALMPHLSHRSGRDADLLLYLTTLEGASVPSPGFIHVREDGLAWDEHGKRFLRFDVERQWLLLKALLEDAEANLQFAFASRTLRSLLVEWATARGESTEIVFRALTVLVQPNPGGEHDDHFHVRTACTDDEIAAGCEPSGPERPWIVRRTPLTDDTAQLAQSLFEPLDAPTNTAAATARGAP